MFWRNQDFVGLMAPQNPRFQQNIRFRWHLRVHAADCQIPCLLVQYCCPVWGREYAQVDFWREAYAPKVISCSVVGLEGTAVEVEVDIYANSPPSITLVGLPDAAVQELVNRCVRRCSIPGYSIPAGG